jgi:hypothetical protein
MEVGCACRRIVLAGELQGNLRAGKRFGSAGIAAMRAGRLDTSALRADAKGFG